MDPLEVWRKDLARQIDEELLECKEEQAFFEQTLITGALSIHGCTKRKGKPKRGGSVLGKKQNLDRKRQEGFQRIFMDYFASPPLYTEANFKRRYRMTRRLFTRIHDDVCAHDQYFIQRKDCTGLNGLAPIQKITAAMRQLALGIGADATDEYCRLAESTAMECLYRFCRAIRELYEKQYLRKPSSKDVEKHLSINERRGFPGMFASLDCMHYEWKNCPVAWQGKFTDKDGNKSIILEAIADQKLWIWHAFFGLAGGNNDLNVLDRSPLVVDLHHDFECVPYRVNAIEYKRAYLLVDSIYPNWSCFLKTILCPQTEKRVFYAKCQEGCRKDVERAFGCLQSKWSIVKQPARSWHVQRVMDILMCCVILHNMIIEDERGEVGLEDLTLGVPTLPVRQGLMPWKDYLVANKDLESESGHYKLKKDLIEHLWARKGDVQLAAWVNKIKFSIRYLPPAKRYMITMAGDR